MNKLPSVRVGHHPLMGVFIDVHWRCDSVTLYYDEAYTQSLKTLYYDLNRAVCDRSIRIQGIDLKITSRYGDDVVSSFCFLYTLDNAKDCIFVDSSTDDSLEHRLSYVLQEFPLESVLKIAPELGVYVGQSKRLAWLEGKRVARATRCGRS